MLHKLKIDYDSRYIMRTWRMACNRIYRVYYDKAQYLPDIEVTEVKRTRKGVHVKVNFTDMEKTSKNKKILRLEIIALQDAFESDRTRSLFDYLRTKRNKKYTNLMFDYKNMRNVKDDEELKNRMNYISHNILSRYYNMKNLLE